MMTSKYLEEHKDELEKIAAYYESTPNRELQFRAKCIRELIRWENLKTK